MTHYIKNISELYYMSTICQLLYVRVEWKIFTATEPHFHYQLFPTWLFSSKALCVILQSLETIYYITNYLHSIYITFGIQKSSQGFHVTHTRRQNFRLF